MAHNYNCLFDHKQEQELIYVLYEDLEGYIHYEYSDDPTRQVYTMTNKQLYSYKRIRWEDG
ncbi:hypothetical protein [Oceanobacillus limi]|uniref:hypothetical protein n=1 Tax=Oceanobacillus limi TaxID=930131 RepID=UPI00147F0F3E|nr:hypothetical protein [Oceanobacillus limi]